MSHTADGNVFADLSGISASATGNPYDGLIEACAGDPQQIQLRYKAHRETRNQQQKDKLLSLDFSGFIIDPILKKLTTPEEHPGYVDPRNCLVFWARPPVRIRHLIENLQGQLVKIEPSLWLMPPDCLHMTALEITHSKTPSEIEQLVKILKPKIPEITDFTYSHRSRLVKPMLSYDGAAIALSFLPAAGEGQSESKDSSADSYTYHHLRRDLYGLCQSIGIEVASRYVVPSAHLTIARFITQDSFIEGRVTGLVTKLGEMNQELQSRVWSQIDASNRDDQMVHWYVGEEKGLECRTGTLWYGGGERQRLGRGFTTH